MTKEQEEVLKQLEADYRDAHLKAIEAQEVSCTKCLRILAFLRNVDAED